MSIFAFYIALFDRARAADRLAPAPRAARPIANQVSNTRNIHLALIAILIVIAAPAFALTPAELVTPQLEARPVSLSSIRDGVISYFDETRSLRRDSVQQFVQVRRIGDRRVERSPDRAMIVLADGQQIAGHWLGAADEGQRIRWRHVALGDFALPIDRVARIEFVAAGTVASHSPTADREPDDRVTFVNGDRLAGFVSAVTDDGVTIIPDGATEPVTIPLQRLALLVLANPARPIDPTQHRVTLDDGTHLAVLELAVGADALRLLPAPASDRAAAAELPIERLVRVDFTGAGYELIDLTTLPMRIERRGEVFGVTFEPRIESGRLHAHAPARVAFDLPAGVRRMAATAELDADETLSAQRTSWAAFELIIHLDGEEAGRWQIGGEHRRAAVNVSIDRDADRLTLELDPAVNGPIMDRLRLRDAMLLRDRPEPRSAVEPD